MFKPKITKEEINTLPIVHFEGEITIVDDLEKLDDALARLFSCSVVGIDTETKPSFKKGKNNKVSLMQVSTLDHCYLFRLNKINFPEPLVAFLADSSVKKVGLSLRDDFSALNKHNRFKPVNVIDIQSIARNYGILELSLQKIYAIVFEKKISKSQQLSNWENVELTPQQRQYAATDAWACLQLYLRLEQENQLSIKEIECLIQKAQ